MREGTDVCGASATQEPIPNGTPKGVMPSERMRGLALPEPLSLERFVALMMSRPGTIQAPDFITDIHPTSASSNSESYQLRATTGGTSNPDDGTVRPVKSGEDLFLRADTWSEEGESVTDRFDCNTVGPVPVASGYGSRTLTHSAAHALVDNKENASALSSLNEKIHT